MAEAGSSATIICTHTHKERGMWSSQKNRSINVVVELFCIWEVLGPISPQMPAILTAFCGFPQPLQTNIRIISQIRS
jgi:hypothetical protein